MLHIHGVKVGSERNYDNVALVTMTSGDQTPIVYMNMMGGSERMDGDKFDILRVLAQPSLDNCDRYDFGEIDI